jgi:hypothetical protein
MASDPGHTTDRIRTALHEAAAAYQPDRATILARVRAGQAGADPSLERRPRYHRAAGLAGIAGTVAATMAAVFGVGVAINWAAVQNNVPLPPAATPTTAVSPHPTTTPTVSRKAPTPRPKSRPSSTAHPSQSPPASPTASQAASPAASATASPTASPANIPSQRDFLWSAGAVDEIGIDNWSQSRVTVRTEATLTTALQVRVRIARTPDLSSTGSWTTLLPADFTTTLDEQPDALVYTFALKPGTSIGPGESSFAVQYNHAVSGRDASRDTYQATATGDGASVEVRGGF